MGYKRIIRGFISMTVLNELDSTCGLSDDENMFITDADLDEVRRVTIK